MFIDSWQESSPRREFGSLQVWDILTKCTENPLNPTRKGAVLTGINSVKYAALESQTATLPSTLDGRQLIMYINSGVGTITSGYLTADLHDGIGVLMPPDVEFSIENTGDDQLTMYLIEEPIPGAFRPRKRMIIKNEYDNPISTNIQRVNDSSKWLFDRKDGLSTLVGINTIMWEPRSYYPPHVHGEGDEEVWIAVKSDMFVQLGKIRRAFTSGSAYKVPPDSRTPHVNINTSTVSQKLLWLMKVPERQIPSGRSQQPLNDII
jgi:mannose-6-phosphate isomerase-like protein (cupin superfamily)